MTPKTLDLLEQPCTIIDDLPETLSGLLRAGLDDLELAVSQGHKPDMSAWLMQNQHGRTTPNKKPVCFVCLAGSTLLRRMGKREEELLKDLGELTPVHSPFDSKMVALNHLRRGHVYEAAEVLGVLNDTNSTKLSYLNRETIYLGFEAHNFREFMADLRLLADQLEAAGF